LGSYDGALMGSSVRTLLFSDIEGSTALLERAGAGYSTLLDIHRTIVREEVAAAGGIEHGTEGDSFFISFTSPTGAATAALGAQRRLEAWPWPEGQRLRVRIGMHAGEVSEHDGDLIGLPVHHAARIAASAHGGQIVASEPLRRIVATVPSEASWRDLGAQLVRDIGRIGIFQLDHPDLQQEFPPLRGVHAASNNLPRSHVSTFVEPLGVLSALGDALERSPIVTLTGTGGVGKTRLAVEHARRSAGRYPDGIWFVNLAPVTDPDAVPSALVTALPMILSGDSMTDAALSWIAEQRVLIIVDNCEHLVAAVAHLVNAIVEHCPHTGVLTTSREPLGLDAEQVLRVESLDPASTAMELFVDRARAVDAGFQLADDNDVVHAICARLDGIPLAVELAAARMGSMSPAELLERLDDRFRVLRGGRGGLDRHQTLRATVSWSYALLSGEEQRLLDRLSVFADGWTLKSVEQVCGFGDLDETDLAEHLHALVDKSLVTRQRGPLGTRYRLLETIRQFAEERLDTRGEIAELRDRHLAEVVALTEQFEHDGHGSDEVLARQRFAAEWENIRSAHMWALASGGLEAARRINDASFVSSYLQMRHTHQLMAAALMDAEQAAGSLRARTLVTLAYWTTMLGDESTAIRLGQQAIEVADDPHEPFMVMAWELSCVASPLFSGTSEQAREAFGHLERCLEHNDDREDWWNLIEAMDAALNVDLIAYGRLRERVRVVEATVAAPTLRWDGALTDGHAAAKGGDLATAAEYYLDSLRWATNAGNTLAEIQSRRALAVAATGRGAADAAQLCLDALRISHAVRLWQKTWQILDDVTLVLAKTGDVQGAAVLLGHLDAHMPSYGMEQDLGYRSEATTLVDNTGSGQRPAIGRRRGETMTALEIVAYAEQQLSAIVDSTEA
jgi:predicted ATPase/class 3 adenylate cyclase